MISEDQPINNIHKAIETMQEGIQAFTRSIEILSTVQKKADIVTGRYCVDQIASMGAVIEELLDRLGDFRSQCNDPELGDQGAIKREYVAAEKRLQQTPEGKQILNGLRHQIKTDHELIHNNIPFTGHFGE